VNLKRWLVSARKASLQWRLGFVVAMLAASIAVGCRDTRAPTDAVLGVGFKPKAICSIDPGPINCNCLLYGYDCDTPPTGDTALIACSPHRPVRGDSITCSVTVGDGLQFDVDAQTAKSIDPTMPFEINGPRDSARTTTSTNWAGRVVKSVAVSATVYVIDSPGNRRFVPTRGDTVVVSDRPWTFALGNRPKRIDSVFAGVMTDYPQHFRSAAQDSVDATYGYFSAAGVFAPLTNSAGRKFSIPGGPNRGFSYLISQPTLRDSAVAYIHPALSGGLNIAEATYWYHGQDGKYYSITDFNVHPPLSTIYKACDTTGVAALRHQTLVHEGVLAPDDTESMNSSHFAQLQNGIRSFGLASVMERMVVLGDTAALQDQILVGYRAFDANVRTMQQIFENSDTPRIVGVASPLPGQPLPPYGAIQCYINWDPTHRALPPTQ